MLNENEEKKKVIADQIKENLTLSQPRDVIRQNNERKLEIMRARIKQELQNPNKQQRKTNNIHTIR